MLLIISKDVLVLLMPCFGCSLSMLLELQKTYLQYSEAAFRKLLAIKSVSVCS